MATNTYVALSTQVLTGTVSSVTFSSIPSEYTDLVLVVKDVAAGGGGYTVGLRFNGETSSSTKYSGTYMTGSGSVTATGRGANMTFIDAGYTGGTDATRIIHLMNYSNSSLNKTILSQSFSVSGSQIASYASLWRDTTPINAIYIYSESGNTYSAGSTFTLYGIANADNFTKATGGIISEDSTYTYHVFGSSGTFTPKQSLTADILVVAGGGSGSSGQSGTYYGFGGGAGEVKYFASQSLTSGTGYTCTVGAGGASIGNSTINVNGNAGSVSTFGALTSAIAGSGANYNSPGGSSGNGFTGGAGSPPAGGGGAGAGANGGAASGGNTPGVGGNGISTYSSWLSVVGMGQNVGGTYYIAGGGGGVYVSTVANGGYGGGGGGGTSITQAQRNGLANTGSGGSGGGDTAGNSGAGGSGVVIIRYPK